MTEKEVALLEAGQDLDYLIADKVLHLLDEGGCRPYSTNIGAAWEIVTKLIGWYWFELRHPAVGVYWARFYRNVNDPRAKALTAPLAVCRAALLTVKSLGEPESKGL